MTDGTVLDLLDPDEATLLQVLPATLHDAALHRILARPRPDRDPRPRLDSHGEYIFGVLVVPTPDGERHSVYYQELNVVLTLERLVVIRKTPLEGTPFDIDAVVKHCDRTQSAPGHALFHLFNEIAEHYLDLIDTINEDIDQLEDDVNTMRSSDVRERLSVIRHDILHIRRTLAPTRDAARSVLDGRLDIMGTAQDGSQIELFPREIELHFADAYDKLLRAVDGLDLSRDLIAGVRDYHQSKIANDQNEVMKRLTIVSSLLLPPTFVVGLYGQNFVDIPELRWHLGYEFSWALILVSTIGQVIYFRRRGWL
ncbi:MAG: magnesium transporter CorA family protein [Acidimicrobiales bacterium]